MSAKPKPSRKQDEKFYPYAPVNLLDEKITEKGYHRITQSAGVDLMHRLIISHGDLDRLRSGSAGHGRNYEVQTNGNKVTLRTKSKNKKSKNDSKPERYAYVSVPDIALIPNNKRKTTNAIAVLDFIFLTISKQCFNRRTFYQSSVTFTTRDIATYGLVTDGNRNELKAIKDNWKLLSSLEYSADSARTKPLFTSLVTGKGLVSIGLNPEIQWDELLKYASIMPLYSFQLSPLAHELCYKIFSMARQNKDEFVSGNQVSISYQSLTYSLGLPTQEQANRRLKQLIINPIESAIEELEEAENRQNPEAIGFQITPITNESDTARETIEKGHLEIKLMGDYKAYFTSVTKGTIKKKEARERKREQRKQARQKEAESKNKKPD